MSRRLRDVIAATNRASVLSFGQSKFAPKHPRERLLRPYDEETRWLAEEISRFTLLAAERAGSAAELARTAGIHRNTVRTMMNGEHVNTRTLALIANKLGWRFTLEPKR